MTVDIMLPFYGDPSLLRIAVRSVQSQDDPDWRLTVVDDGYPDDGVRRWFEELRDERIDYRRNAKKLGANGNYRRCLDLIEHDVAVLMGADDIMLPHYVSTIKQVHRAHPEAGIIQVGVELIDENGKPYRTVVDQAKQRLYAPRVEKSRLMGGEELATSLLRGNWLYFPALAWRSDALRDKGFRDGLKVVQDLALVIDLLLAGETMVVESKVCFQYRRHRGSDSSLRALTGTRFIEERRYFLRISRELEARGWHCAARVARNHVSSRLHALTVLPQAIRHGHRSGIQNLIRHAFMPARADRGTRRERPAIPPDAG
ncbi:glycosyltransferase family 2 protein [Saccharopolyspora phatthalungensis]|uniref:Glycosyltransferase involved in cell wall biosynthesis n=1 Tax=Saccharopolyspora phatthalungensis TaxID=664693 RepID=A0A840QDG3_9PSEU|nr:glycosyltransferase family 2 protein [Saccharopolyspora phatthalungensis]MBB5157951.1 glycosyltransferase involved in cell wall biosynthesis [Saccharopolyspora phatthalungensis]